MFRIIKIIVLLGLFPLYGEGEASDDLSKTLPKTNVLIITVDDMNWDSIGTYGSKVPNISPNIDRLAAEGLRFEYAHVVVPVCAPSRAALMTGRYPHVSGAIGFPHPDAAVGFGEINSGVTTLVEELRRGGYITGLIGKTRHTIAIRANAWHYRVDRGLLDNGRHPDKFEQFAEQFLIAQQADIRPFYLQVNIHDPHRPFAGSEQEDESQARYQPLGWWHYPTVNNAYEGDQIVVPPPLPDLARIRAELAQYFTSVKRADETVGRLLKLLDKYGVAEDTLVIFLSDHGMPLPFAKSTLYMYGTRTPLIIKYPGQVAAGTIDTQHLVSGIDLMPTVLDSVGLPVPANIDGTSLLPILRGESLQNRDHIVTYFFETFRRTPYPSRAINGRQYGYIYNAWSDGKTEFVLDDAQSGYTMKAMIDAAKEDQYIAQRVQHYLYRVREEFYDYEADPGAHNNLVNNPEFTELVLEYKQRLLSHMQATDDPLTDNFAAYYQTTGQREEQ